MDLKNATAAIKALNPKNISGTIPQALDLILNLQKSKGNPKMVDSVGASALAKSMAFLQNHFAADPTNIDDLISKLVHLINSRRLLKNALAFFPSLDNQEKVEYVSQNIQGLSNEQLASLNIRISDNFLLKSVEDIERIALVINGTITADIAKLTIQIDAIWNLLKTKGLIVDMILVEQKLNENFTVDQVIRMIKNGETLLQTVPDVVTPVVVIDEGGGGDPGSGEIDLDGGTF